MGDDVRFKVGDDLNKFWDNESEMVAELFKTLVREEKKLGLFCDAYNIKEDYSLCLNFCPHCLCFIGRNVN